MTDSNGVKEQHVFGDALPRCPACGATDLEPVVEYGGEEVHFRCRACSRCWFVEFGWVHRLSPHACNGCEHSEECIARYRADHA